MRRSLACVVTGTVCAMVLGVATSSALAANTLGPPPWKGALCPPIGLDTGCQYGVDVTAVNGAGLATTQTIAQDGDQPNFDNVEDAMLVIKNDASTPLKSLHMGIAGSGQQLFGFDGDGLCTGTANGTVTWTPPAGCPFNASPTPSTYTPTGYEGPGTWFAPSSADSDNGNVNFNPALAPGQTTYFSLETNPNVVPTVGNVNNWITSAITAPGQSSPGSYVAVPNGTNVTDQATINGTHGAVNGGGNGDGTATGTVVYELFANDNSCSTAPVYTSAPKAVTAGVAAPSDPIGAQLASGRYYWLENYSGDHLATAPDTPSSSICGQEILDIGATQLATHLSSTAVAPGTPVTDSASLTAVAPGAVSGTISFAVYSDSKCLNSVSLPSGFTSLAPANGGAVSPALSLPSGTYYWVATYSGDSKNAAGSSACGSEVLHVANNNFVLLGKAKVIKGFKLVFKAQVTDPGKFSWSFTTPNKHQVFAAHISRAKHKRVHCAKGKIRFKNKCVPALIKYGSGSSSGQPGIVTLTVTPSHQVVKALGRGWSLALTGTIGFHSSYGGTPTSQPVTLTVNGTHCSAKRHKKHLCVIVHH